MIFYSNGLILLPLLCMLTDETQMMADNTPVILVLMHHTREPKCTNSAKTWLSEHVDVSTVDVFYHDTMNGLLQCTQNNQAVLTIQDKLLKHTSAGHDVSEGMDVDRRGNDTASTGWSSFLRRW